jgi:hypothetical protein
MSKRTISLVLIVGGAALLALSLGADLIGIGAQPGMHWKQWTGVAVGLAALAYGFWLGRAKAEGKK